MHYFVDRWSHLFPSLPEAWYAIPLRLIVGYGFMEHGYPKLPRGPDDFATIFHALGIPAPTLLSSGSVLVQSTRVTVTGSSSGKEIHTCSGSTFISDSRSQVRAFWFKCGATLSKST